MGASAHCPISPWSPSREPTMSTERAEGYHEALSSVRTTIQRRVKAADISHEGKLELLDLLSMLDDMLNSGKRDEDADRSPPVPLSGSF